MLVGDPERFAIEACPEHTEDSILGRFRFWIGGEPVGDWDDLTHLTGCYHWLREFERVPRDRSDPRLDELDGAGVFQLVWNPVFGPGGIANPAAQPIPNAYSRFHITHLGMTSFDNVDILLVKTSDGRERCLWRTVSDPRIRERVFEPEEMESVARAFCDAFESAYMSPSPSP